MDDIDDDKECENPKLIRKSVRWIKSALIGTISIKGDRRIIMVGNRIHKESILAHYVGDVHEGDPVRPGINQIKVFALENPRTHKEDQSENGKPAWKERYSRRDLETVFEDMGYAMAQREFFHRLIEEGTKFKSEWLVYDKIPALKAFQSIVTYCDPSFKEAVTNDFKAIVCVGYLQPKWYILDCWVRQASRSAMVSAHYDMAERLEGKAKIVSHHIEANFTQDMMIQDYVLESTERRYMLPINEDLRAKPKKEGRIESLTVYFEKGLIIINDELIHDKTKFQDWQAFKDQLIGFPDAPHDDAPDAFEGAMFKIREAHSRDTNPIGLGGKRRDTHF